jgi:hypothetical protein
VSCKDKKIVLCDGGRGWDFDERRTPVKNRLQAIEQTEPGCFMRLETMIHPGFTNFMVRKMLFVAKGGDEGRDRALPERDCQPLHLAIGRRCVVAGEVLDLVWGFSGGAGATF